MKIQVVGYGPVTVDDPDYPRHLFDTAHEHFNVWGNGGGGFHQPGTHEFEVDPQHLFDDQVNTTCGVRIHDWADYMSINRRCRWGHYIINLEELNEYRRQFFKCGYCGHMDQTGGWCPKCRGSEYLEENHYPLLWMNALATEKVQPEVPTEILASIQEAQMDTFKRSHSVASWRSSNDQVAPVP